MSLAYQMCGSVSIQALNITIFILALTCNIYNEYNDVYRFIFLCVLSNDKRTEIKTEAKSGTR